MSFKIKFDVDGRGDDAATGMGYSGPNLVKGVYIFKVKRMTMGEIKAAGANHGKPRISILLELVGPESAAQYKGHPVWDGLNIIKSSTGFVNAFLHALTDGSKAEKDAVETAFWSDGPKAEKETNKRGDEEIHIKQIGKYKINSPKGELLIQAVASPDQDLKGNFRAKVSEYVPFTGPRQKPADDDADDADEFEMEVDDDSEFEDSPF